jgi:hypothetical protein
VIRDLIGLDEDTLSVIFGESLPEEAITPQPGTPAESSTDKASQDMDIVKSMSSDDTWQTKLLERVAQELGVLVHQLSEHPGAFSTYQRTQSIPDYAGLSSIRPNPTPSADLTSSSQPTTTSPQFAPTFPAQQPHAHSEASLWGIEEEGPSDTIPHPQATTTTTTNIAEELAAERAYWEREIDVKMIFNFLMKRFSRHSSSSATFSSAPPQPPQPRRASTSTVESARRAAIIRQHHPLVNRTANSSTSTSNTNSELKRYTTSYIPPQREQRKLRSSSSCASQRTKRSGGSGRNYWDLGGSVGSGSLVAGEV